MVFLVIKDRRRGRRDEEERHHYKYHRNGFDCVGVESRDQHEHKQCFQLFLQQQQIFYPEAFHSLSPSIIINIIWSIVGFSTITFG